MKFCQSCGMPLTDDVLGTNADGSKNEDYCIYCYKDGKFLQECTMDEMIEHCAQFVGAVNEGYPCTKAMLAPRNREGIKTFYFTTNTFSLRVAHYKANPKASIYFCDAEGFKGMMLRGTMEVLTDAKSKEMIWREGDEQYYPEGVTDPNYCVLKFTATDGRFYSDFYPRSFVL